MVGTQQKQFKITHRPTKPNNNGRVRCIQQGLGATDKQVVTRGGQAPYQPPGASSSFPSDPGFWEKITILLHMDNVTAVTYVCKPEGRYNFQPVMSVSPKNMELVDSEEYLLVAVHLPGHLNILADQESQSTRDHCNWMLNPIVFHKILSQMGLLEIDCSSHT